MRNRSSNWLSSLALLASLCATTFPGPASAADDAYLRIVDVGAGLCVIAIVPGGHAMIYDTGAGQKLCMAAVDELVPGNGAPVDLLVLSHSDIDHIGAAQAILASRDVRTIVHTGDLRTEKKIAAVRQAIAAEGATVHDLSQAPMPFGTSLGVGEATATFIAGWSDPDAIVDTDPPLTPGAHDAERHNGVSIVIRFAYRGHSVLLAGDTLGRIEAKKANDTLCQYAERKMVANQATVSLKSDILIAGHHGSDDATSNCFIRAVEPDWVVFSAGHEYFHPRQSTADRLTSSGIAADHILRTDRGDVETPVRRGAAARRKEWVYGSLAGCTDKPGDDDVEIGLPGDPSRDVSVAYRVSSHGC